MKGKSKKSVPNAMGQLQITAWLPADFVITVEKYRQQLAQNDGVRIITLKELVYIALTEKMIRDGFVSSK